VPRVDLRKFLAGGVAGRREAVALVGDALREEGAVRVEGHEGEGEAALATVASHLLAALEDYFGLATGAFQAGGARAIEPPRSGAGDGTLIVVLGGVPPGTEIEVPGNPPRPVAAHPGELLAAPGPALSRLTGGVVSAASVRWPAGTTLVVALALPVESAAAALPEFRDAARLET
jgi:hypothetical protein